MSVHKRIWGQDIYLQRLPCSCREYLGVPGRANQSGVKFYSVTVNLIIKAFFGTSENAVKAQIWIAVSVYVLVAIIKKRLNLSFSLYEILQILSLTLFEKVPLDQLLTKIVSDEIQLTSEKHLFLFE